MLANLEGTCLREADLRGADLQGADLRGADLQGANLQGANLQGADLRGASLQNAYLSGTKLGGTRLYGAILLGATLYKESIIEALYSESDLHGALIYDISFIEVRPPPSPITKEQKAKEIIDWNNKIFAERAKVASESIDGHLSGKSVGKWVDAVDALNKILSRRQ